MWGFHMFFNIDAHEVRESDDLEVPLLTSVSVDVYQKEPHIGDTIEVMCLITHPDSKRKLLCTYTLLQGKVYTLITS